jgi:hypothetical protein
VNSIPPAHDVAVRYDYFGDATFQSAIAVLAEVQQIRLAFANDPLKIPRRFGNSLLGISHPFQRKTSRVVSEPGVLHP